MATGSRSYATGYFALNLDGFNCGLVQSVEGGNVSGDVISDPVAHDYYVKKHIGQVKYEDFSLRIGLSMGTPIYDWISAFMNGNYQRKDGEILAADFRRQVREVQEFLDALITEITFPAMDAASKDAAYMTLKFRPWLTRRKKGSGEVLSVPVAAKQKQWLPANFRLAIDGLDCKKVSKVDSFTVKQVTSRDQIGEERDYLREPGKLDFPNLRVTLAESAAKTWLDWHEDFVVKGNCGDDQEKNGSLTFLSPDLKHELMRLDFFGLGIFRLTPDKSESQADQVKKLLAELYCERMALVYPGK